MVIRKVRPSWYLSGLMACWGIINMCMGFVQTYQGLVVLRFFLGAFEAGVMPGIIYLTSMYYKRHEFQTRMSFFFCSTLIGGAVGGVSRPQVLLPRPIPPRIPSNQPTTLDAGLLTGITLNLATCLWHCFSRWLARPRCLALDLHHRGRHHRRHRPPRLVPHRRLARAVPLPHRRREGSSPPPPRR